MDFIKFAITAVTLTFVVLSCSKGSTTPPPVTSTTCGPTLPTGSTAVSSPPIAVAMTGCTWIDYSLPIKVGGTSNIYVIADSGSTVLAMAGSNCSNCTSITPTYPVSHGTSLCESLTSTYGDGSGWVGPVYQDTVTVGTLPAVTDNFSEISQQTGGFFSPYDCEGGTTGTNSSQGIMGLAYSGLSTSPAVGYLDAEQSQLSIPNVFSVQLCGSGGMIWFGGYDSTYTTGASPQYTPVTAPSGQSNKFYWVTVNDMQVGGSTIGTETYITPIVDTGTSITQLPPQVFNDLQTKIAANATFQTLVGGAGTASTWFQNGNCIVDSNSTIHGQLASLPPLTLVLAAVGGGTISVSMPATESYLDAHMISGQVNYCQGFASNQTSVDFMIIGGSFLRSLITIFDRTNNKVGFVPAVTSGGKACAY